MRKFNKKFAVIVAVMFVLCFVGIKYSQADEADVSNDNAVTSKPEIIESGYSIKGNYEVIGLTANVYGVASAIPYTGKSDAQHIAIDWTGACDASSATEFPFTLITFVGGTGSGNNNGTFTDATWSVLHTFPDAGTYPICVKVYHANFNGNDGEATLTLNLVIPSLPLPPENSAPTASDIDLVTNENTATTTTLIALDADVTDILTYSIVDGPGHGTLSSIDPSTHEVTYTPTLGWNGSDSFTYKANDSKLDSNTATVNITVNPIGDPAPCTLTVSEFHDAHSLWNVGLFGIGINQDKTLAYVKVVNKTHCSAQVSLGAYKMFDLTNLSTQKLFDTTHLVTIQPQSSQMLTVKLPSCAAQIDAFYGDAPSSLVDSVGTYDYPNIPYIVKHKLSEETLCQNVPQNTPPVITLKGDNPMTIYYGTPFVDPGVTAWDAEDGDLTNVIVMNTVDTSSIGTFRLGTSTIYYLVQDSGGLFASTTRTVYIVESTSTPTTTPVIDPSTGGRSSGSYGFRPLALATSTPSLSCPLINSYLRLGANNDPSEVMKLQSFLKQTESAEVDVNGIFDQKTLAAVNAFQTKYLTEIMGPWGATRSSGNVYIMTKKKINQIACDTAFMIDPIEQAIIDAYKASQNQVSPGFIVPGSSPASSTSLDIGLNNATSDQNLAAVGSASSVLGKLWGFIKSLF